MKTKLIILPEQPIIVSDEEIKEGDLYYHIEYDKIFKAEIESHSNRHSDYYLNNYKKIIAGIEGLPSINFNGLEEEFGIVDVEKIALQKYPVYSDTRKNITNKDCNSIQRTYFIEGFKKAQSLNEKKFSIEDMRKAMGYASDSFVTVKNAEIYIQSLQQSKVFDIEIEMEDKGGYRQDSMNGTYIFKIIPKITNNQITILKKL